MRYAVTNLRTSFIGRFTDADLARDGETLAQRIDRKACVYGRGERREPAASDLGGWRIEADADGELWLVQSATIAATEVRTPLRDARPDWYAVGEPKLDSGSVIIPAEYKIEVIDTSAEEAKAARKAAVDAVQARLDAGAQSWGYDSIVTAGTYADEPSDPVFQAEGKALRAWRSVTWRRCWQVADTVASIEELLAALPALPERPTG